MATVEVCDFVWHFCSTKLFSTALLGGGGGDLPAGPPGRLTDLPAAGELPGLPLAGIYDYCRQTPLLHTLALQCYDYCRQTPLLHTLTLQ